MRKICLVLFICICAFSGNSQSRTFREIEKKSVELEKVENYEAAFTLWSKYLQSGKYLQNEKSTVLAQVQFFKFQKNGDISSLKKAFSTLQSIENRQVFQTNLLLTVNTAYYHYLAENSTWEASLKQALKGFEIKDFNQASGDLKTDYLYDLGFLFDKCENPYRAILFYKKSLQQYIKKHGEINQDVALTYNNLAFSYGRIYNQKNVINYYKKAAEIWEKLFEKKEDVNHYLITVYQNLNSEYIEYGSIKEGKKINEKLNAFYRKKYANANKKEIFNVRQLMLLSNVRTKCAEKDFKSARKFCDSLSDETNTQTSNKEDINFLLSTYSIYLDYLYENNLYSETIELCNTVLPIAEKNGLQHSNMLLEAKLATSLQKINEPKKALNHIEKAASLTNKNIFNSSPFSIQCIKAKILFDLKEYERMNFTMKANLEAIVKQKTGETIPLDKITFASIKSLASPEFINIFCSSAWYYRDVYQQTNKPIYLKRAEQLYVLSSKLFHAYYKKGEYNDVLDNYHSLIKEGLLQIAIPKSVEQKVNFINKIEQNSSQHLNKEYDKKLIRKDPQLQAFYDEKNAIQAEIYFYENKNKLSSEDQKRVKSITKQIHLLNRNISKLENKKQHAVNQSFDIKLIMKSLAENEQIIKYYVGNESVFRVLISSKNIAIQNIGKVDKLQDEIVKYIASIKALSKDYKLRSSQLFKQLIPNNTAENLTLIPESFLNYLPFESLWDTKNISYLVATKFITYDYSLPMYVLHKQKLPATRKESLIAFAPYYGKSPTETNRGDFKNLKYAKKEASEIVQLFDGKLLAAKQATKRKFLSQKEKFSTFHFSMHAKLVEDDFNKSYLLFANNEKLQFSELYALHVPADLVVLSACNTGTGENKKGEGLMSLARSLSYSGVKSSVVSLWEVPDKETSELMIEFYKNLKKGETKDQALKKAKQKFIEMNPLKSHPYYWAGFILTGETAPLDGVFNWWYLTILLLFPLLYLMWRWKLSQLRK